MAEYDLAQASLHRSLNLAERIGDTPLSSVVFSNLAELAVSSGNLAEAERLYKKSLILAEGFNDREYMCRWNAGLAAVLQAQGKHDEAAACVQRAWSIGRNMHNAPCIGVALLALANLRIAQAQASPKKLLNIRIRLLAHARKDIEHALALEGLEAETHTRSLLALAEVSLLRGEVDEAQALANQVTKEAQRYELVSVELAARKLL